MTIGINSTTDATDLPEVEQEEELGRSSLEGKLEEKCFWATWRGTRRRKEEAVT